MSVNRIPQIASVLAALLIVYLVYSLGATGALFYDDYGNLEGLAAIQSWSDAQRFALSGMAGPSGRPLALFSFIPHAAGWPGNSAAILTVNIAIHLANALLLGVLGYLLLGLAGSQYATGRFKTTFFAALLWAVMPLLASTTLIAIQRMTGLSAFFGLLGLLGFTWSYRYQYAKPVLAFLLQMGLLGAATLLAILSKENGALIPLYALLIDAFVVKPVQPPNAWLRHTRRGILLLGLVCILVYLSPLMRDYGVVSEIRGYSVWDRLQTQVVVLWQYMRAALLPLPSLYGPFHDYRGADYAGAISLYALLAWVVVLIACIGVHVRYKISWPIFALLWYFVGHLIESTSIMLEIYFEHRNYLSIYGLCLALAVGISSIAAPYKKLANSLFLLYVGIQLSVLFFVTSVWGKPDMAAEIWAQEHPASSRAAIHAVFQDLGKGDADEVASLSHALITKQRYEHAADILDRTAKNCPTCLGVRMQGIVYGCLLNRKEEVATRLADLMTVAQTGKDTRVVVDTLFRLRDIVNAGGCDAIRHEQLVAIIQHLAANHLFQIEHILTRIYFIAAALQEDMGNTVEMDRFLSLAEKASPVALPVLQYQIYSAHNQGDLSAAQAAIARRYEFIKFNTGIMTKELLDEMLRDINQGFSK